MAHFLDLDGLQTLWNSIVAKIGDMISTKADLASPALTGTPKAPTAASGTNTTQIATTAFVQTAISPFGYLYSISLSIAGRASGTANLKPDTGAYSVWLITVGYNSASGVYDYAGLIFVGTSSHVFEIAKGASSDITITISNEGVATIANGVTVYARVGLTRLYKSG